MKTYTVTYYHEQKKDRAVALGFVRFRVINRNSMRRALRKVVGDHDFTMRTSFLDFVKTATGVKLVPWDAASDAHPLYEFVET